jgi:hypothetical protein
MSSQYVNITADEMRAFLRAEKGWTEFDGNTREYVFVSPLRFMPNNTVLKVWTGINKHNSRSRARGNDAIRVCVVEDNGWGKGVMATSHVKRVHNWRNNLLNRIVETIRELKAKNPQPQTPPQPQRRAANEPPNPDDYPQTPEGYRQYQEDCFDHQYDPADEAENQALGLSYGRYTPRSQRF